MDKTYWAAKRGTELAKVLEDKVNTHVSWVKSTFPGSVVVQMFRSYYGVSGISRSDNLMPGGLRGEKTQIHVNAFRRAVSNVLNFVGGQPLSFEPEALNSDSRSSGQALVSKDLLRAVVTNQKLDAKRRVVEEYAALADEGYYHVFWDNHKGEMVLDQDGNRVYDGDIQVDAIPPWFVVTEPTPDGSEPAWKIVCTVKNKYDIIAHYPEYESEVLSAEFPFKDVVYDDPRFKYMKRSEDYVAVWRFYHDRTPALPNGAFMEFVTANAILDASDPDDEERGFGYKRIPLIRVAAAEFLGAGCGRSPFRDILALNQALDHCMSVVVSNAIQHGHRNITSPVGNNVDPRSIVGGYNILYYTKEPPKPMDAPVLPAEIYRNIEMFEALIDKQLGLNNASTGSIDSSSRLSSASISMLEQRTLQFLSGLQASVRESIKTLAETIIECYQLYALSPRVMTMVGENNKAYVVRDFSGQAIKDVARVRIPLGDVMAATPIQRYDVANMWYEKGAFETPLDWVNYINTGSLAKFTEKAYDKEQYVRHQNEMILKGEKPPVLITDDHVVEARQHMALAGNPALMANEASRTALFEHVQEHYDAARSITPEFAAFMGHTPIMLPAGPPAEGGSQPQESAPQAPPSEEPIPEEPQQ